MSARDLVRGLRWGIVVGLLVVLVGDALGADQPAIETRLTDSTPAHADWTPELTTRWPGCVAEHAWVDGRPTETVIIQDFRHPSGTVRPMPFDRMWSLNHNQTDRDDVWVVGVCKGEVS